MIISSRLLSLKSRHNDQLQLAVQTDCQAYLQARMTLLESRLEEVNVMALAGDLPDVDISDKGIKLLRWKTAFLQVFPLC